jgi:hypothetical protein
MAVLPHIYALPAASSLKVVVSTDAPREAAADLVVPFWTDRSVSGNKWGGSRQGADIDNPEAGFWRLLSYRTARSAMSG